VRRNPKNERKKNEKGSRCSNGCNDNRERSHTNEQRQAPVREELNERQALVREELNERQALVREELNQEILKKAKEKESQIDEEKDLRR